MANYDTYYQTPELFGEPYKELVNFFINYPVKGKLLDLGCGQGRNALVLAGLGYEVTGIDGSKVGIEQMIDIAKSSGLSVQGLVADIYHFNEFAAYDIVLLDSMFHFEKQDLEKETGLVTRISKEIKQGAIICICIQDTGKKVKILKDTLAKTGVNWQVLNDSSLIYKYQDKESGHSSEIKYCMYILKKHL